MIFRQFRINNIQLKSDPYLFLFTRDMTTMIKHELMKSDIHISKE